MDIKVERTPNPSAMKFTVGVPVGGPATYTEAGSADERIAPILGLEGVTSVFMTSDFITVSGSDDVDWDVVVPDVITTIESSFA